MMRYLHDTVVPTKFYLHETLTRCTTLPQFFASAIFHHALSMTNLKTACQKDSWTYNISWYCTLRKLCLHFTFARLARQITWHTPPSTTIHTCFFDIFIMLLTDYQIYGYFSPFPRKKSSNLSTQNLAHMIIHLFDHNSSTCPRPFSWNHGYI